jgi:ribonuclease-3
MKVLGKLFGLFDKKEKQLLSKFEKTKLENLSKKINISFHDSILFAKALTHRSYLEKNTNLTKSNERLEFLGDAVLGLVVADILFKNFPQEDEGFLTKTRSHIVDKQGLLQAASRLNLIEYILYDERFIKKSQKGIESILADSMEALIGAIYLDVGIETTKRFIEKWITDPSLKSGEYQIDNNFKGQLLEYTHAEKLSSPNYILISSKGPDHNKEFIVEVQIDDVNYGYGRGKNKKAAEQKAAKAALSILKAK